MLPFTRPADGTNATGRSSGSGLGTTNKKKGGLRSLFNTSGGGNISTAAAAPGLVPGKPMAPTLLPTVQGGHVLVGAPTGSWQLIFVTRGRACPVSRNFLAAVNGAAADMDALGVECLAVSADQRERAEAGAEEVKAVSGGGGEELGFKVAYGLTPETAGAWGLYMSEGPSPGGGGWGGGHGTGMGGAGPATPANIHPEPAVILLTPDGDVSLILKSSSAFGWPDLRILVEGIRFMQEKGGWPVGGTVGLAEE